jgi:hypothetical protein
MPRRPWARQRSSTRHHCHAHGPLPSILIGIAQSLSIWWQPQCLHPLPWYKREIKAGSNLSMANAHLQRPHRRVRHHLIRKRPANHGACTDLTRRPSGAHSRRLGCKWYQPPTSRSDARPRSLASARSALRERPCSACSRLQVLVCPGHTFSSTKSRGSMVTEDERRKHTHFVLPAKLAPARWSIEATLEGRAT